MAQKPRTAKQLANDQRLRERAAAKKAAQEEVVNETATATGGVLSNMTQEQKDELLLQLVSKVQELEAGQTVKPSPEAALQVTAEMTGQKAIIGQNGIQGIQYRYPVDKSYYPDPTQQLYDDERLRRFAMQENFIFKWDVEGVIYDQNNVTYAEPRFVVELYRKMFDEDGNEKQDQMIFVNRLYLHEDELVARIAAEKLGLTGQFESHDELLNAMRVFRIKQWLYQLYFPEQMKVRKSTISTVIDGKAVEIVDREEFTDAASGIDMAAAIRRDVKVS